MFAHELLLPVLSSLSAGGDPSAAGPVLEGPEWSADGDQEFMRFGACVASAGDVDGDGHLDLIVGAPWHDAGYGPGEGRASVFLGSASGPSATPHWSADGGRPWTEFGSSVAGAGDVDGDGYDDVIVGAPYFDDDLVDEGYAALFLGSANGPSPVPDWTAQGDQTSAFFGVSVAGAGDVNGDGFDDVIVGAHWHANGLSQQGRACLYLGSPSGLSPTPDWIVDGDRAHATFGRCVAGAGDTDGDGYDDVIVGAPGYTLTASEEGAAFLYLGSSGGLSTTHVWRGRSNRTGAHFGLSVAGAGDVNADGHADVVVGAPNACFGDCWGPGLDEGRAYLYLGTQSGLSISSSWSAEGDQFEAFLGTSVAGAGDVDGDGYDDVAVGAPGYTVTPSRGFAFLYRGAASGLRDEPGWIGTSAPWGAFGSSLAGAGDMDGDGFADLIVGAPDLSDSLGYQGRALLYHGKRGPDCNGNGVSDQDDIAEGTSADRNGNAIPDECESTGLAYCSGDGSGTPCPCGNAGASGHGCANGSFAAGASLVAIGGASVATDELRLYASSSAPSQPGLFFQGDARVNGGVGEPFGDGLRCAGTAVVRLELAYADDAGSAVTSVALAQAGGVAPGETLRYQWWYRDPLASPCGARFNLSNGVEIDWVP